MSNEELLKYAEGTLHNSMHGANTDRMNELALRSIASSLLVIAREMSTKKEVTASNTGTMDDLRQADIDREVGRRVTEYKKFWNPETGMYEIDKGDPQKEWICTEDELYDDVRKSVEDEI